MHNKKQIRKSHQSHPFLLMLKRDGILCFKNAWSIVLITIVFAAILFGASLSMEKGADSRYINAKIALVDEDASFISRFAIGLVSNQEFASQIDIEQVSKEKAENGIQNGEYAAIIKLPDDYANQIMSGQTVSIPVIISEQAELHAQVISQLVDFGEDLMTAGQFGVFAGGRVIRNLDPDIYDKFIENANLRSIDDVVSNDWFQNEELTYMDTSFTTLQWYQSIYGIGFLLLSSLSFYSLAKDKKTDLLRNLRVSGISYFTFISSKWLLLFCFYLAFNTGFFVLAKIPFTALQLILFTLFLSVWTSTIILILPKTLATIASVGIVFISLFCAGGIVPRIELPKIIRQIGDVLPIGLLTCLLSESIDFMAIGILLVELLLCIFILLLYFKKIMQKGVSS